jgi:hypothetical protein
MDRDRITRTGASTPGVEQHRLLSWRCPSAQLPRHSAGIYRFGSGEHEGRMQTRWARQLGAYGGKAPFDRPTLKPYRGKPAVRNFRGGDGNVGIIRSPVRAIALPDNRHEGEDESSLRERSSDPLGPESCAATARDPVKRRQGYRWGGPLSCEKIQPGRRRGQNARKAT